MDPEKILQTGMAFWGSKTLLSAVELGVFSALASGELTLDALRSRLGLHERGASDFLDALVAMGFLERNGTSYRNTPESDLFLDHAKPSYVGGILEMANARLYPFWGKLTDALRTGEPQSEACKASGALFDNIYGDEARQEQFLKAMTGVSHGANLGIAAALPWDRMRSFVDVGTAQGDLAVQIAKAHPQLNGVGFDLPSVRRLFEEYVAANSLQERLAFQAGDFFQDPLPSADVILMGHILHDWDLPTKRMLLGKAFAALPQGGLVVVYDAIIDDARSQNAFGLLMSLNMLVETPGGFDYTGADCQAWMREAGFVDMQVVHLVGPDSMVVGRRP